MRHGLLAASLFVLLSVTGVAADRLMPLPEHGLRFKTPVTSWDEALPLGNGILGALVWGDGRPVRISLDRTDLWDLRPVPEFYSAEYRFRTMLEWHDQGRVADLLRLYEAPYDRGAAPTKIPAGRIELNLGRESVFKESTLSLADALATLRLVSGAEVQVLVHARTPVGLIRVTGVPTITPSLLAPPFGGAQPKNQQDLANLGYPPPDSTGGADFQAYRQRGYGDFEFAVYLGWRKLADEWLAAWSVATNREGGDPLNVARERVRTALGPGFRAGYESHRSWWEGYWGQSAVRLPDPTLERLWYLEQYKFGSASRRGYPPITLQGPWTADNGQIPPWKGDYHHDLNTQLSYWACYSGNHLEEGLSYLDWLWNTRQSCFDWTRRFFDQPGLNVPMTADLNNNQIGGWRQYTHSSTTAAWLAHHFYLHWKYSADRVFLRDRAYPYLKDAAVFLEAMTSAKGPSGKRTLALSASPEYYDNRPQAWFRDTMTNYDAALCRWLFGAAAELADELGLKPEASRWRTVLAEMPALSLGEGGELLLAPAHPVAESHRHFSQAMALHPLGLIDWSDGEASRRTILGSLKDLERHGSSLWCGYSFAWLANIAARARDGERAERALETFATAFTLRNSFHCNGDQSGKGLSRFTYRPFTLEGNFAAAAGLQEMLLQSHGGKIRVFPAIPRTWTEVSFDSLRAEGAFLVSASRSPGRGTRVSVTSEKGGRCVLVSPADGTERAFSMKPGQRVVTTF